MIWGSPELGEAEYAEEGDYENDHGRGNPEHDAAGGGRKQVQETQFGPDPEFMLRRLVGQFARGGIDRSDCGCGRLVG